MLLDDYLEELEKQARLSPWAVKNISARVAPINNTKVLGPVRKQVADVMNRQTGQALKNRVASHVPRVPANPEGMIPRIAQRNMAQGMQAVQNPVGTGLRNASISTGTGLTPLTSRIVAKDNKLNTDLYNTGMNIKEWATRPPFRQWESIKRNIAEGMKPSGKVIPYGQPSILAALRGKFAMNPGINFTDPEYILGKLTAKKYP